LSDGSRALPLSLAERLARHERAVVLTGLALVTAFGLFGSLLSGDALMAMMAGPPGPAYAGLLFVMWWTMMMAMMLPSAAPAILIYGGMRQRFVERGVAQPPLVVFVLGYAAIWTLFSAAAVALQLATSDLAPLSPMYALTSRTLGGLLLVAAGLYQFTPLKNACLRRCQSPFFYLARHWRNHTAGTFAVGWRHGLHCLGCCWVLMLLLFYGGVMELRWIVGLALYVAAEKLIPAGHRLASAAGIALIGWGAVELYAALS
jgi:predicted metal-binding membrane protein